MSKHEFLEILKNYLSEQLPASVVDTNVKYYSDYIEAQIAQGSSEAEVVAELGDPRIIGKTIIEAEKNSEASDNASGSYYTDMTQQSGNDKKHSSRGKNKMFVLDTGTLWGKIKLFAMLALIVAIFIVIVRFAVKLLMFFLPVIVILMVITYFTNKK